MKKLSIQEQYEWYIQALREIGTHLLDLSDDLIGDYVFEDFDDGCTSFLHPAVLNPLLDQQFITEEIYQGLPGENGQELSLVAQVPTYTTLALAGRIRDYLYGINNTLPAAMAVKKFYFTFDELAPPTAVKVSRAQLQKKI